MKKGYYTADNINGVRFYAEDEPPANAYDVTPEEFAEALATLTDDAYLVAYFAPEDADTLEYIDDTYGVRE